MGRYPYTGQFGLLRRADEALVMQALSCVHGEDLADLPFTQVSDGQRQKVLLARALCQQPDIILLDEPTSNLDSLNETVILKAQKSDRICSHKEELFRLLSESVIISTFG